MALDDDKNADRDSQPDDDSVASAPAKIQRETLKAKRPAPPADDGDPDDEDDDDADDGDPDDADDSDADDSDADDSDADDSDADDDDEDVELGGEASKSTVRKPSAALAIDEDEDEDDEDEDAELAAAARRRRKRKRGKKRRPRPPVPKTEAELNSPTRAGTLMVWTLVGVTLVLWLFARTACNFNPPQTEKPKLAELDVLAREPKGAAVEFEIRLREHRFAISEKLANASGAAVVQQAKQACGASCAELEHGSILCQGSLLERAAATAKVRVQCELAGKVDYQLLSVVREQNEWKVSAREGTVAPPPIATGPTPPSTAPGVGTSPGAPEPGPSAPPSAAPSTPAP